MDTARRSSQPTPQPLPCWATSERPVGVGLPCCRLLPAHPGRPEPSPPQNTSGGPRTVTWTRCGIPLLAMGSKGKGPQRNSVGPQLGWDNEVSHQEPHHKLLVRRMQAGPTRVTMF